MVSASGDDVRLMEPPATVVRAYVVPDATASSTPATGAGPVEDAWPATLTSSRPTSAAASTTSRPVAGARRCRTASATVSRTGASPRLTTVETATPTWVTETK